MSERTNDQIHALNESLADQRWAELDERLSDIQRIGIKGPESEEDRKLVKKVMLIVAASLYMQRGNRND